MDTPSVEITAIAAGVSAVLGAVTGLLHVLLANISAARSPGKSSS